MKYRKKPIVIEAFKWGLEDPPRWWLDAKYITVGVGNGNAFIPTLEGIHEAKRGDMIIQGIKGEIYPCKPDIFEATYEEVSNT